MVMSTLLEKLIRAFMTICLVSGREVGRLINTGDRPRVQQTGLLNSTYTGFSKLSHRRDKQKYEQRTPYKPEYARCEDERE